MLVYSRNSLISLHNWYKTFKKLSTPLHGSVVRPVSTKVWEKLAFHNFLASTRGQQGRNHLRNWRSIATVNFIARSDGASNSSQKGSNCSNLLNIHIDTSRAMTTTTIEHQCQTSNLPKSRLKIENKKSFAASAGVNAGEGLWCLGCFRVLAQLNCHKRQSWNRQI